MMRHPMKGRGPTSLHTYLEQIQGDPLLSAEEERSLAEAIASGDRDARARMIRANLRLVVRIARDYAGRGLGMEDLIGEGNLGLIRAAEQYDPRFGTRFSTYASYWIKQAIRQALITTTATIRLPAHMVGLLTRWRRAERALARRLGYEPPAERIAEELGLTAGQRVLIERALRANRLGPGGDGEARMADEAADPHEPPDSALMDEEGRHDLGRRLGRLDDRERTILALRFGLDGQPPLTLKEVGKRLGVTREWVRKIEARAVQKLDDRPAEAPARPRRARRELQTA